MTEPMSPSVPEPALPVAQQATQQTTQQTAQRVDVDTRSEVRTFVVAVRARLADLSEEEREELVGGLDADMSDLVAERGVDALPEPVAYATELRSAAGITPEPSPVDEAPSVTFGQRVTRVLDRGHERWEGFAQLYSVFPLPEQTSDPETGEVLGQARLQTPPFVTAVQLAGVNPSVLVPAAQVEQQQTAALKKAAEARREALRAESRLAAGSGG